MNWGQNPALRPISLATRTKRGTVGTINKCERWLPRRPSLPVHSAATIACAAPLMLADAQGYFADQNVIVSLRNYAGWAGHYSRQHAPQPIPPTHSIQAKTSLL